MNRAPEFADDVEFHKLVARQPDVDLTIAALEIARDADPTVDFGRVLKWIDDRAAELFSTVSRAHSEQDALRELASCLSERCGLAGDATCYDEADSSYLHRVIDTGRGIPISLSLVYMAVANRVGLELKGVSTPVHFLTRYESVDGPVFVDAFSQGRLMTESECIEWVSSIAQLSPTQVRPLLRSVDPRVIMTRMLNNLKILHAQHENWNGAMQVQRRLLALHRSSYEEQRDLALIMARTSQSSEAIKLLQACLSVCPDSDREILERQLQRSRSSNARWN